MINKKFNSRIVSILLLLAVTLLLNACAGFRPKSESIRVNLSSLEMLESTVFEQRFKAAIRIQNRSQSVLAVNGLSYDLALNDKDFASGVSNQKLTIEPLSEGVITVNLTSTLFSLMRQIKSVQQLESKPFSYDLYGNIYTDNAFFGISFSENGEIDLTTPTD